MGARRQRGTVRRAITAVIAGYALLLQSFLAIAAPAAMPDAGGSAICAPEHDAGSAPAKAPVGQDHRCCTAACLGVSAAAPPLAFVTAARPDIDAVALRWQAADSIAPRAPPRHAAQARGPPSL